MYLQSVLCFYYVHVCALKSVALITISLSMGNLLCGTIVVLGIGLPSVMWVSHQQKFATIWPGSQYDTGAVSVTCIVSIAKKLYVPGQNAILNV